MGRDDQDGIPVQVASPPCLACEIAPDYFDPLAVDPQQAIDVARWRRAERARLRALRHDLPSAARATIAGAIAGHLAGYLEQRIAAGGLVLSAYWPIKDEPDLRPLMHALHARGVTMALPVVETRFAPLVFRAWQPGARMERGDWNIPVPAADAPRVTPDVVLAPVMGWDGGAFRLGYGGGYFDRTLARMNPRPLAIGIGPDAARLSTIFPQPHDIAMDIIITESGVQGRG